MEMVRSGVIKAGAKAAAFDLSSQRKTLGHSSVEKIKIDFAPKVDAPIFALRLKYRATIWKEISGN
jgi:hypothetical protein